MQAYGYAEYRLGPDMSREINEVMPGLFISGMLPACEESLIRERGITRVIRCGEKDDFIAYGYHKGVEYMDIVIEDSLQAHFTRELLDKCVEFISCDAKTLVHCWAGVSRSATIVIAYMIARNGMGVREARLRLKDARTVIAPNKTFMKDLVKYHGVVHKKA